MEPVKHKHTAVVPAALAFVLLVAGCDLKELEKTRAEAKNAKARLAQVTKTLAETTRDRDECKAGYEKLSEECSRSSSELTQARDELSKQVKSLTRQRKEAIGKVKAFQAEFERAAAANEAQALTISKLYEKINKQKAMIKELQDKLNDVKSPALPGL